MVSKQGYTQIFLLVNMIATTFNLCYSMNVHMNIKDIGKSGEKSTQVEVFTSSTSSSNFIQNDDDPFIVVETIRKLGKYYQN